MNWFFSIRSALVRGLLCCLLLDGWASHRSIGDDWPAGSIGFALALGEPCAPICGSSPVWLLFVNEGVCLSAASWDFFSCSSESASQRERRGDHVAGSTRTGLRSLGVHVRARRLEWMDGWMKPAERKPSPIVHYFSLSVESCSLCLAALSHCPAWHEMGLASDGQTRFRLQSLFPSCSLH